MSGITSIWEIERSIDSSTNVVYRPLAIQILAARHLCWFNPILHEGGHIVPTHVDNLLHCFWGCSKWAHFSWLCFLQYLPSRIEAIFEKKNLKNLEILKKIKFCSYKTFGKNIEKKRKWLFLITNHNLSTWNWFLYVFSFLLRYITYDLVKIIKFLVFYLFYQWPISFLDL